MRPFYFACWPRFLKVSRMALVVSLMLAIFQLPVHAQGKERPLKHSTVYRTIQVDGLSIFYREAGPKDLPTLLVLHCLKVSARRNTTSRSQNNFPFARHVTQESVKRSRTPSFALLLEVALPPSKWYSSGRLSAATGIGPANWTS